MREVTAEGQEQLVATQSLEVLEAHYKLSEALEPPGGQRER